MHSLKDVYREIRRHDCMIARLNWIVGKLVLIRAIRDLLPRLAAQLFFTILCIIFGLLPVVAAIYNRPLDVAHLAIAMFTVIMFMSGAVINAILTRDVYLEMKAIGRFCCKEGTCTEAI